jgi:hypothetical protein
MEQLESPRFICLTEPSDFWDELCDGPADFGTPLVGLDETGARDACHFLNSHDQAKHPQNGRAPGGSKFAAGEVKSLGIFHQVTQCDLSRHVCRLIRRQMASLPTWAPFLLEGCL